MQMMQMEMTIKKTTMLTTERTMVSLKRVTTKEHEGCRHKRKGDYLMTVNLRTQRKTRPRRTMVEILMT
jgi:hypothetical protein